AFVDVVDDVGNAGDVGGPVGNDQAVGRHVGGQVAVLGNQRAQDRHQLVGRHVVELYDAGDDFLGRIRVGAEAAVLFGVDLRDDLDDFAGRHGGKAMHLQHRQKGFIQFVGRHRRGRQH